jgi:hypothetical protein
MAAVGGVAGRSVAHSGSGGEADDEQSEQRQHRRPHHEREGVCVCIYM